LAGFLIFNQAYVKQESAGPANIEATPTPEYSLLSVLNNNVQIKELSDTQFRDAANQKIPISKGTHVKTSLTGRAIIEFPNQTTTVVDKNSEFAVTEIGENKTAISLALGGLWAKVQKVFGKGEYYQVETPNSVATVRGTSFGLVYANNITTILVAQSQVALISIDPVTKKQIGEEIIIDANHKGTVANGQAPKLEALTSADKALPWYIFNQQEIKIPETVPAAQSPPPPTPTLKPTQTPIRQAAPQPIPLDDQPRY